MTDTKPGQGNPDPKASASFRDNMKATEIAARDLAKDMSYVRETLRDSAKELNKIAALNKDYVGASKKLASFAKDSVDLSKDLSALYDAELQTKSDQVLKQTMLNSNLRGEYAQTLATAVLEGKMTTAQLTALKEELSARQHITEQVTKSTELIEAMAAWQDELHEELEGYSMGWDKIKRKIKTVLTDPQLAKAVLLTTMVEKSGEIYEGFEKLNTSGLAVGQRVDSMVKGFSLMSVIGLSDTAGVLENMRESMGTLNSLTSSEVDHVGHLAKEMGVTGQEAFGLVEGFSKLPGETMATATHAADYVKSLSKANGVAPGKITKEIAKNTELMALGGYKSAKAFTEAAMKAQKMGVELSTTLSVAKGLLNFEDSINKQMEASVLLGKQINFDKARQLALEGKSVEATQEVLKNIGGQAAFDKMNVLQKEALASATGMTVEQMQKMIDAQVEYNKYHGEDVSMWKSGLGYAMEYAGGVTGFLKENGIAILAAIQLFQTLNLKKMAGFLADKAMLAWNKIASLWRTVDKTKEIAQEKVFNEVKKEGAKFDKTKTGGIGASVGPMLAFGAAVLMVGVGIGIAAAGMAQLVESFKGLTNAEITGAVLSLGIVMGGFIGIIYALAAALPAIGAAAGFAAPGLYAIGGAVLMIGLGIGIAAAGMALFVNSIAGLANEDVVKHLYGVGGGLYYIAGALGAVALAGIGIAALVAVVPALGAVIPAIMAVQMIGLGNTGTQEPKTEESQFGVLQKGVDELNKTMAEIKDLIKKGGDVYMDTSKVGEALTKGMYFGKLAKVTN
jgi:hypothetical protein